MTSLITEVGMLLIWARFTPAVFDPGADLAKIGHTMILYDPRLSLVGWRVLMILISPVLQPLMTIFGGQLKYMCRLRTERE